MLKSLTARKQLPVDASPLTIRYAAPDDATTLDRLAELDSSRAPRGTVLVAEINDEMWAALSLDDGHAVSDPWHPSAEALWMLIERSRQLRRKPRNHARLRLARA
jgi:hypothetical protein